jgi:hypothetical protein
MRASPNKDGLKYGVVCDFLNGSQIKYQLRSDPCLTLNFTRGTATNITGGNISWRPNAPKNGDFHALHDSGMALEERLEYPFAPKKKRLEYPAVHVWSTLGVSIHHPIRIKMETTFGSQRRRLG